MIPAAPLHKLSQADMLHVINRTLKSMPNLTGGLTGI